MIRGSYALVHPILLIAVWAAVNSPIAGHRSLLSVLWEVRELAIESFEGRSEEPDPGESPRPKGATLERQEATVQSVDLGVSKCRPAAFRMPWKVQTRAPVRPDSRVLVQETKPDSVRIFLLATPVNHRSPPA